MSEFISIHKSDDRFLSYIKGTFSKAHRALPQKTFQKDATQKNSTDVVVFKILPLEAFDRPGYFSLALQTIRWKYLTFSVAPILATWGMASIMEPVNVFMAFWILLGVLSLQISGHLLNDYYDHINGYDQNIESRGSRSIQRGFLSAQEVFWAACFFLLLAVIIATPVLFANPKFLIFISTISLFFVVEFSSRRLALKSRGLGELTLILLSGPLLTLGFTSGLSMDWSIDIVLLGVVFGLLSGLVYHLKNIAELRENEVAEHVTLATKLGFDRSLKLVVVLLMVLPLLVLGMSFLAIKPLPFVFAALVVAGQCYFLLRTLGSVRSPFSSEISQVRRSGLVLHFSVGLAFILATVLIKFVL